VLPGGFEAPASQVAVVRSELERIRVALEGLSAGGAAISELAGTLGSPDSPHAECADYLARRLTDERLQAGIARANRVRRLLGELRWLGYTANPCPMPALEMLVAEMLAIHFCSDQGESIAVLEELLAEARARVTAGDGVLPSGAARVFWVNPVADLRVMNLLEDAGGRICGTEYLFCHALDPIPDDLPPMEALARMALADPMVGSPLDRADRICRDVERFGAEAVVISRIPGASHCGLEGLVIGDVVRRRLGIPAVEIEVPPITDSMEPSLRTRLEALVETVVENRKR
jgi:benzoyl-CoA reductase/2-hydroxyglutaryl-CoA dehydratase subunit BcrC/BadD/HgdB